MLVASPESRSVSDTALMGARELLVDIEESKKIKNSV